MSIVATKKFLVPDLSWVNSVWGRVDQGRRELAVALGKDVTVEKLAELAGLSGPSLSGWKAGGRPKRSSVEAVARVFLAAGLMRYTARYLDWGPEDTRTGLPIEEGAEKARSKGFPRGNDEPARR